MPVSTDGVLLGAWADIHQTKQLLDIGTGTGLLALMCAQRNPKVQVSALELDEHAYQAAKINFERSPWPHRLELILHNILTWQSTIRFDHIICNPPYFNSGEQARNTQRASARHTDNLPHDALLNSCWQLLGESGSASFVLPKFEGEQFISIAKAHGWSLSRYCEVKTTPHKPASRLLFELSKTKAKPVINELVIHDKDQYSEDFITLTRDFYLKM